MDTGDSMGKPSPGAPTRDAKKKLKRERWLLTRKTWRYMADAGRKLIPDGATHKDDLPKIEAYFQEVCNKEPRFLLWRKQSYPGAFRRAGGRRTRKKGGSCRDRTSSADESEGQLTPKFDLRKMKEEFLFGKDPNEELLSSLKTYLYGGPSSDDLLNKIREQLNSLSLREKEEKERNRERERTREREEWARRDCRTDTSLLDTIRRYYGKSTNRERIISDLLTDRKRLERFYFDLRKARSFNPRRSPSWWKEAEEETESSSVPGSPPLVVEELITTRGTQTKIIAPHAWTFIAEQISKLKAKEAESVEKEVVKHQGQPRRSSVDNDDVSPSVSDTIKRYLRMARKKSVDSDKVDRFKRVNYDRNLRNIKGKGVPSISEDEGNTKSAQTDEVWIEALREVKIDTLEVESAVNSSRSSLTEDTVSPTSPTSKSFLSSGQHFLSNLLHGLQDRSCSVTGGMQKSKSSTSVVQQGSRLVAKKIWKSRSKSQSRATPSATSAWTPQVRQFTFRLMFSCFS